MRKNLHSGGLIACNLGLIKYRIFLYDLDKIGTA